MNKTIITLFTKGESILISFLYVYDIMKCKISGKLQTPTYNSVYDWENSDLSCQEIMRPVSD